MRTPEAKSVDLDPAVLSRIVSDWINEGFTTPPYDDAYYDLFEFLGVSRPAGPGWTYDTRRPSV